MSLSPKTKRIIWVSAAVIGILLALGGFFTWTKFFREEKEMFANEEEHFKYGSLGAEGDRGIPYYLWMVLPRIFPDLMPGPGGYKSFGVVWEEGHENSGRLFEKGRRFRANHEQLRSLPYCDLPIERR